MGHIGFMPEKSHETHSVESLRFACDQLDRFVATSRRIADEMERAGISVLDIDYQAALRRAMSDLNRWSRAAEESLVSELHRRGAFKAQKKPDKRANR